MKMKRTCKDIRNEFIGYFEQRGHTFVPSSPLLPAEDPTLLFTNAGMNQFKDIFLGLTRRDYVRAVNSQKCIRAGGKHNDLEDVGHDTYHHTFFEMLGNWSFGDYFKADAIQWAWELLTKVWGLDKSRLYATVFQGDATEGLEADEDAAELWRKGTDIDPAHIFRGKKKDNFWEMGETGPCGPCSEIHVDMTPDKSGAQLVNAGDARVIEIWNLVFMQYNRAADGKLSPLPATHVDTGMGFERICMVLQGKHSNYATDLFVPIIQKIETLTSHRYGAASGLADRFDVAGRDDIRDVACRVIADHARTLTFAITDGVLPSNEGRGYVLRRILRRAARYGRQYLAIHGTFVVDLVPTVVELMSEAFPEIADRKQYVIDTIREEEESFGRTLDRGIELFQRQADKLRQAGAAELPGEVVFDLYATYGFPVDLTQIMAAECGLQVDQAGYEEAMDHHRKLSSSGKAFQAAEIVDLPATDDSPKYRLEPATAKVLGWVQGGQFVSSGRLEAAPASAPTAEVALVLDRTSFYAEQGGQVSDTGTIEWDGGGRLAVTAVQLAGAGIVHLGTLQAGTLAPGQAVRLVVDRARMDTMRNHTGTHLMNWALKQVLGEHVEQAGSVVSPDRLRFDFSHTQAVSAEQIAQVERMVNQRVLADEPVEMRIMPMAEARKISGVRAVFGEKYPDPVRVVMIGPGGSAASAEFCGGTHLARTGQIGPFKILSEESVAKGVRRINAVTGRAAVEHMLESDRLLRASAFVLRIKPEDLPERLEAMHKELKELKKPRKAAPAAGGGTARQAPELAILATLDSPAGKVLIARGASPDANAMRAECDHQRQKGAAALMLGAADGGKVMLVAMVSDALVKTGKMTADKWVKAVAPLVGGGGGGRETLAQAGGKDPAKLEEALTAAVEWARKALA
jgi:alanyl-tRNA synthetase